MPLCAGEVGGRVRSEKERSGPGCSPRMGEDWQGPEENSGPSV